MLQVLSFPVYAFKPTILARICFTLLGFLSEEFFRTLHLVIQDSRLGLTPTMGTIGPHNHGKDSWLDFGPAESKPTWAR